MNGTAPRVTPSLRTPHPEFFERQHVGKLTAPELAELIHTTQNHEVCAALTDLLAPEISDVLVSLDPHRGAVTFRLLPRDTAAEVFNYLSIELQEKLLSELSTDPMA